MHQQRYVLADALYHNSMWLHLHHGDVGLQTFLSYISAHAHHLLIEAQHWKNYKSAVQRRRKSQLSDPPCYASIRWRNNVEGSADA